MKTPHPERASPSVSVREWWCLPMLAASVGPRARAALSRIGHAFGGSYPLSNLKIALEESVEKIESRRLPLRARAESRPASFACPAEPAERQLRLLRRPCIPTLGLARLLSLRRWPGAGEGVERNRRRREGVGRVKLRRKEPREYNARIAYVLHAGGNRPEACLLHRRRRLELLRGSRLPLLLGTATLVS